MPLTEICNREYSDPRQRQLFKNIIYVGALSALLDIDVKVIEVLIGEQFKGKDKLIQPNIKALHMGREHALKAFTCPIGLRVRRAETVGDRIFIDGNNAAALGSVYGGAPGAPPDPSTPSSPLSPALSPHPRRYPGRPLPTNSHL